MYENEDHPCEMPDCENVVIFDDEAYCFACSPNGGSYIPGYSHKAAQKK